MSDYEASAEGIKAALTHRVGPLPVAGWAGAILGGLGISWYLRNHRGSTPQGSQDAPTDVTTAGTATTPGLGGAAVSDPANPGNTNTPTDAESAGSGTNGQEITTNGQWRQQAVKWLISDGLAGTLAERTVGKYLAGSPLVEWEAGRINRALAALGPTPAAVPAIHLVATAKAPTGAATTHYGSNAAWRSAAIKWLATHGHSGQGSTTVVDNYLAGRTLAPTGSAAITKVIGALGPPPQAIKHHAPNAHKQQPTAAHHAKRVAHPNARRDSGTNTNP